jgi:hypothetical protein
VEGKTWQGNEFCAWRQAIVCCQVASSVRPARSLDSSAVSQDCSRSRDPQPH